MFSDTHFHYSLVTQERGLDGAALLTALAERNTFFAQDIGTGCGDLAPRQKLLADAVASLPDTVPAAGAPSFGAGSSPAAAAASLSIRARAQQFIYFSAGIWPAPDAIRARKEQIQELERQIAAARASENPLFRKVASLGECGLDHHWNPDGADGRAESDFDAALLKGEAELFEMQLELARRLDLPVIVHSRDAFDGTLGCIKDAGYDTGIIHCYSYGVKEARAFLDRGWYISLSGSVTYTKKAKMDEMNELLRYIPADRLLLETDAPYLAPVPMRGQSNTPVYVSHTYEFVSAARSITPEQLSALVDANICALYKLSARQAV